MCFNWKHIAFSQQEEVLSELYSYSHQTPVPSDSFSAQLTLSYLKACNLIFEQGLLSHDKVTSSDCQVIHNIQEGYQFFTNWLDEIYAEGEVLVRLCAYVCVLVCMYTWMYASYICACTRGYVHVSMCASQCECVCVCVCVCVRACVSLFVESA